MNDDSSILPLDHVPTVEEIESALKTGHRTFIRELDEWRPLAEHVRALIVGVLKGNPRPTE